MNEDGKHTFNELDFKSTNENNPISSRQAKLFFENGFGVSVVIGPHTYGGTEGLYELAVLEGTKGNWEITYDTPLTDDVLGRLSEKEVEDTIAWVKELGKKEAAIAKTEEKAT